MANAIADGTGKQRADGRAEGKDCEKASALCQGGTQFLKTKRGGRKKLKRRKKSEQRKAPNKNKRRGPDGFIRF